MGLGKTYSADYLIDSNGNTGVSGQVLISTATGIDWADGTAITGGPYLPLAGGRITGTNKIEFNNGTQFIQASDGVDLKLGASDDIILETNFVRYMAAVEYARITGGANSWIASPSTSKLGIGTTSPSAKLHILNAAGGANIVTGLKLDPDDATTDSGISIDFNASTTNTGASLVGSRIVGAREGGNASGFLALYTSPDASGSVPLERMRISSAGNVGIGTTSPSSANGFDAKLQLESANPMLVYKETDQTTKWEVGAWGGNYVVYNGTNERMRITASGYTQIKAVSGASRLYLEGTNGTHFITGTAGGDLGFYNNTGSSYAMFIKSNGNVGIGNTSPQNTLHLGDNANSVGGTLRIDSFVANQFWKLEPGTNTLNIKDYDGTSLISFDGANNYALFPGGNVGIGTTGPAAKLDVVVSNVSVTPNGDSSGVFRKNGNNYISILSGATNEGGIIFGNSADAADGWIAYKHGTGAADQAFAFGTANGERMRIDSAGAIKFNAYGAGFLKTDANGNITAGAVTTSDTLDDVTDNGNSTTNSITVGNVTSTGGGQMQGGDLYFKNGGDDGAGTRIGNVWYSVSTGGGTAPAGVYESAVITTVANGTHGRSDLVFKTKDNDTANFGSSSERMRITKAGNVGIGDTSPTQISANTFSLSVNSSRTDLSGGLISKANGTVKHHQYWDTSGYSFSLAASSGNFKFTGGNVGIETTNPATLLHLGKATNGANIISFGEANVGGPHGLNFYGDDATRTLKYSIYYRTGTENISMETGNGTKRFEINQNGGVTFNEAFTFPTADGSAGAALVTNGSGALSWNSGYKQYSPVGWGILNNQTYTSTGSNISSSSTQAQAGTTPVQRNSATEFEATKAGWYEISYSFLVKNNYTNRAMIGAYMGVSTSGGGGTISGSHSTQYVRYNTYGEYAQIQNTFYYYTSYSSTKFYLYASLLSGSMNMTTQAVSKSMISFRYINNDIT